MKLTFKDFSFNFLHKTYIMGVLNVTPDSFSDGGIYFDTSKALAHAQAMVEEGADIIDIGGESTRPGSKRISAQEEIKRVVPVIKALSETITVPVSIDTYKSETAKAALDAGASMINDISGFRFDSHMAALASQYGVPVIMMHMKGMPDNMQKNPAYSSLIQEIIEFLEESITRAVNAGIDRDKILLDPGIGFGKTFRHNLEIINKLKAFEVLKCPIVVGLSRKAFIGDILGGLPPHERVHGTASAVAISVFNGVHIVRVHDVKTMAHVVRVADAIKRMDY
jgi:dihydropteroate synthase